MIWFEGEIRAGSEIPLDAGDRGLLLGDGVFETVAVFRRRPFALDAHLALLAAAGEALGFTVPLATVREAIDALVGAMTEDNGALRVTVSRGTGPRGLLPPPQPSPVVLATLAPWSPAIAFQPVTLATVSLRRNETSPLSRLKTLAYLDPVLALAEARRAGADDALLLNTQGRVAGSSMANLFALIDGTWVTPPVADGVRPGVMRGLLLGGDTLGGDALGGGAIERSLDPAEIRGVPLALTNSLRLALPVVALDGQPCPPVPEAFMGRLRALVT